LSLARASPIVPVTMPPRPFIEDFEAGPGGWIGWDGAVGATPIEISNGAAVSRSPWWVDYNHAPPGAGYLHILFALHTFHWPGFPESILQVSGPNRYVDGGYPTDLRNAQVSVRLRGEVALRGAQLVLLAQGNVSEDASRPNWVNQVLAAQPLRITPDWSEQVITLAPDQAQWVNLGTRHDREGYYGRASVERLLGNVNGDIIFVLFPLDVRPAQPIPGDPHRLRAGQDYQLDTGRLPDGYVMLDRVQIDHATHGR